MDYEIDSLDRDILRILQRDARTPYLEIGRELGVSGGTIHVRLGKLREAGVLCGSRLRLDYRALGFDVAALVGIRIASAHGVDEIRDKLRAIPEIVEIHYTTGRFSLVAKVVARKLSDLYSLLSGRLREHIEIASTETFVILRTEEDRDPQL